MIFPEYWISVLYTGCSNPYQEQISTENLDAKYGNHEIISLSAAAAESGSKYTVEDLRNLQDFLLVRETPDLSGKDYDLNNDDRWDVFDLCLMRRELLGSMVNDDIPIVYMTKDISSESLMNAYLALEWNPSGNTAVKLSTGEPPASNYLRPELIKDVVQYVDGTIVECNTAYGGSRSTTAMHYQVAEDHGFTEIADFQILDENGSMTLPVEGGSVLTENYVGAAFADYDSYLILSHFKGHAMAGYGGAIKNISIGLGSSDGNPAEPDMHDIGILSSTDPVALDQACIDLVYSAEDGATLIKRIESRNGLHTLEHADEIGLGSRQYQLVMLDE